MIQRFVHKSVSVNPWIGYGSLRPSLFFSGHVTMDASLQGFRLTKTSTYHLDRVCHYLKAINAYQFEFGGANRMVFAGTREGLCVGVMLTMKDQKKFPEIELGKEIKLYIHDVGSDRNPFDFNFFAIDPQTSGGLYQHYRGSCHMLRFGQLLGCLYDDLLKNNGIGDRDTLAQRTSNHRSRADQLNIEVVCKREAFEELVGKLEKVSSFEFDVVTQEDMSDAAKPYGELARLERRTVKFNAGVKGIQVWPILSKFLPKAVKDKMFRVTGTDEDGNLNKFDYLLPNPDRFATDNVDELADEVVLTFSDITKSTYVDRMVEVMKQHPALLGREEES